MSEALDNNIKKWKDRIREKYLLIIRNEESFEEISSFRLSLLNLYILAASLLVVFGILLFMLIAWTPLKQFIPGYGDIKGQVEYRRLVEKIVKLEEQVSAQEVYNQNIRRMLTGQPQTTRDVVREVNISQEPTDMTPKVPEDAKLRENIERKQDQNRANGNNKASPQNITLQSPKSQSSSKSYSEISQLDFFPPVQGVMSSGFAPDKNHFGIDLVAPKNTPIKAVLDGIVISADWTLEAGNTISIQHSNNLLSVYKHNSALLKKVGNHVKAGEAIAIIGNTGTLTSGPHLHLELWHNGYPINAAKYIRI